MSPIGRVFVVINLILSVAFVAFAGNLLQKGESFKTALAKEKEAHDQTKADLQKEIGEWTAKHTQAREDFNRAQNNVDTLNNRTQSLEQEIKEWKTKAEENAGNLAKVASTLGDIKTGLDDSQRTIKDLRDKESEAVKAKETAEKEKLELDDKVAGLTNEMEKLNEKVASLETSITGLEGEKGSLIAQLEMAKAQGYKIGQAMKQIEAKVFDVKVDLGLVTLSVGSDDGVAKGYTFEIFRGSQFKARVRVVDVDEKLCVAKVEAAYPGRTIAKGDDAKTNL